MKIKFHWLSQAITYHVTLRSAVCVSRESYLLFTIGSHWLLFTAMNDSTNTNLQLYHLGAGTVQSLVSITSH